MTEYARILTFLTPEELRRFVPFATRALISPEEFFEPILGKERMFRHDWELVGREKEVGSLLEFVAGPDKAMVLTAIFERSLAGHN